MKEEAQSWLSILKGQDLPPRFEDRELVQCFRSRWLPKYYQDLDSAVQSDQGRNVLEISSQLLNKQRPLTFVIRSLTFSKRFNFRT